MFHQKVLYPEYERNMTNYNKEAQILIEYMKDVYGTKPYIIDSKGLIIFPLKERWLRGEEYGFLLRHYKTYNALAKYPIHFK
jgi:hypothetical protein